MLNYCNISVGEITKSINISKGFFYSFYNSWKEFFFRDILPRLQRVRGFTPIILLVNIEILVSE